MIISIIAAFDKKLVIGNKGSIPWHLPADLKHFQSLTNGKPVVMGRVTLESIGKPLAGRTNIILTRDRAYKPRNVLVVYSVEEAIIAAGDAPELMVIGGAAVYGRFLSLADRMYLTFVDGEFEGDTYFPFFDREKWKEISREIHPADEKNPYSYAFVLLGKK